MSHYFRVRLTDDSSSAMTNTSVASAALGSISIAHVAALFDHTHAAVYSTLRNEI
jgi:hypothetical protein